MKRIAILFLLACASAAADSSGPVTADKIRRDSSLPGTCTEGSLFQLTTGTLATYKCNHAAAWVEMVEKDASGNVAMGATCPTGTPAGAVCVASALGGLRVMVPRIAAGAIAAHSLVKGVAGGKVGALTSDTEGILGVSENATASDGDTVWVTELGQTSILCESGTDLNYLAAGTDPTKVKDSGQSTMTGIPLTTRIVAKAVGACTAGTVAANVIGPYRFGAQTSAAERVRTCEVAIGDPGSASPVLATDNDSPGVCANLTGSTMTITEVKCLASSSTGSPSALPIITGGAADSILTGAIACGNGVFGSAGTLNGTPTQVDGATIDANISVAGGTAKYMVIRIKRTL